MPARVVLIGPIAAALLFIAGDLLGLLVWKTYDYVHQSVSQLTAIGAPTRSAALPLFVAHDLALLLVGLALWMLPGRNVALRITAGLVIANAVASFAAEFFPARVGVRPPPLSPGVILGATFVVASVLAIAFSAAAFSGWFRVYSIGTLVAFGVLTILGFMQSAPRMGLQERVMQYAIFAWIILLGVAVITARSTLASGGQIH